MSRDGGTHISKVGGGGGGGGRWRRGGDGVAKADVNDLDGDSDDADA